MKITIKKEVFNKFNHKLKVVFILLRNIDNQTKLNEAKHLVKEVESLVRLTFNKPSIKNHHLIAPWVVGQEAFGKKLKHYHTSVERLLKKVLMRKTVTANDVVSNLVRFISMKHIVPFGIDDLDKIKGEINFSISSGRRKVSALRTLKAGELYYHDKEKILGMKLDYWKSSKTNLSSTSRSALIHFETLPPLTIQDQNSLLRELKSLIKTFCNGEFETFVLDKKKNSTTIRR